MSEESIFINRELSWLDFNRRVLALGKDKNVPLAERVKFLAIYGSNLDEFFMVRVGSLQERANLEQEQGKKVKRENKTNMSAAEQLTAIMPKTAQLQEECDKYYAKALEALAECGWRKVDLDHLSKEDEHFWKKYFQTELFPILSPQIVDNRHPFPFLRNKEIYLGVLLKEKHPAGQSLGIIPISSQMERMHVVKKDGETQFALTEELVLHFAASIFGKETIQEKCLFRVTRNADIDVKEGMMDHDIDFRDVMSELLKMSPYDFENLIVRLLIKMGYGTLKQNEMAVTPKSGDEGIDGIVSADKFGFDSIYIQAKKWRSDSTVGRPEIQKFLGALAGQGATKGIFITTAHFSKEAIAFAEKQLHQKIVLVDGNQLTELMIEYNLGVSVVETYVVKRVDYDFFNDEL